MVVRPSRAHFGSEDGRPRAPVENEHAEDNLPIALSSFVGRARELLQLRQLLTTARLLTLTGSGGVGKTRLAIEVAGGSVASSARRVYLVELAAITQSSEVARACAEVLGVPEQPGRRMLDTLRQALRDEELLLILDNCEQVLQGCADFANAVLGGCPNVQILATSRERLGITGETVWRVPPLGVPSAAMSLEQLKDCDSMQLFVQRAAASRPDFAVSKENARAVANLCERLEGIPLAIELAAAQLPALSIEQIAERLDDALRLLVRGSRVAHPRQQALRATIDWSYTLLDGPEQILFDRLSVFAGGWTLEAAEQVAADSEETKAASHIGQGDVTDLLTRLVAKSVVVVEPKTAVNRFRLLETLRQYAAERLEVRGQSDRTRRRHAAYYTVWAEQFGEGGWVADPWSRWAHMAPELGNVRAALRWHIDHGEVQLAQRLAGAMGPYWRFGGGATEGRAWLAEVNALSDPNARTAARLHMLIAAGHLASEQADYAVAPALLQEALALGRAIGNRRATATTLYLLAQVAWYRREFALAKKLSTEARAVAQSVGLRELEAVTCWQSAQIAHDRGEADAAALADRALRFATETNMLGGMATALTTLCQIKLGHGDVETARALIDQAAAIHPARGRGVLGWMWVVCNLGRVAVEQGDLVTAHASFLDALIIARDSLGGRGRLGMALEGLAQVAAASGRSVQAFHVAGAAAALRERHDVPAGPTERVQLERWLAKARSRIGRHEADTAWEAGRHLTADEAVAEALAIEIEPAQPERSAVERAASGAGLTAREWEVAMLVAGGLGTRQIAERLVIAEGTVRVHVERILSKLGLHSRTQLAAWAVQRGPVRMLAS